MSKYNLDLLWDDRIFNIEPRKYSKKDDMVETHYHTHYEIYYQFLGDRYYFIKDRTYHIQEGTLVFINTNDIHKTLGAHKAVGERILVNFKRNFVQELAGDQTSRVMKCFEESVGVIELSLIQKKEVEELLFKMMAANKEQDIFLTQILLSELLIMSNKYLEERKSKESITIASAPKYERIGQIAAYLNANYNEKITLENVAKEFYISPFYLSRIFKEGTGFNLINYVNYIRINKAKELLETTDLTIMTISEQVGFESTTHFDRVFKDIVGRSPLKYRKNKI